MSDEDSDEKVTPDLEWRDYIAIAVAALETVLLPLVALAILMIVVFIIIR